MAKSQHMVVFAKFLSGLIKMYKIGYTIQNSRADFLKNFYFNKGIAQH